MFSNSKCPCPTDKLCQRFTCPNCLSTCPGQSDLGFGAPCVVIRTMISSFFGTVVHTLILKELAYVATLHAFKMSLGILRGAKAIGFEM